MSRGRSKSLIQKRDEALCRRWYYWTEERRLRFDDAVKVLSEQEFFISEQRVLAVIRKYSREHPDGKVKPKPRVKVPRLTAAQLTLFTGE